MAKKKKKRKKQHRLFWFIIKLQIFLMLLVLGGLGYYYYGGYAKTVQQLKAEAVELVMNSSETTFIPNKTSEIYDVNGNLISELASEKDAEYVKYEDIPAYFTTAMVSIEDKKFYNHHGIDYIAMLRAFTAVIKDRSLSQGGSTITMQLARNIYLNTGKTWERKVKEMFIALELESRYSKSQIMEFYLNNIYFSNGYYGIESACHGYFSCELSDLSLSQIAFLCAIPNRPSYYDPLVHFDNTIKRRNLILKGMLSDGKITQDVYEQAINEEIVLNPSTKTSESRINNYVDTYVYLCATKALMDKEGFEFKYYFDSDAEKEEYDASYNEMYSYCQRKLYSEGYKIYTSIDLTKQNLLQEAVDSNLAEFTKVNDEGTYTLQGAAVSIDNNTGYVVAIVGGRDQNFTSHTLNRAFQSHRQPGSSIKPLIVYTPSFENGHTPADTVDDHKFEDGPSNYGDNYYGNVSIRYAVQQSLNTVAWQLYEELTPEKGLEYLKKMNFTDIVDSDYVTATSLGGFTNGVSPVEMASAYATIENDGIYREPTCVKCIVDADENIVYQEEFVEKVIYSETATRMMTSCMEDVMTSGTGRRIKLSNMPCAGKTGTTNDQKDGWFVGFTRYYTTAVWVGCDIPKKVDGLTGSTYPGAIWKDYMSEIHEELPQLGFLPYAHMSEEYTNDVQPEEPQQDDATVTDPAATDPNQANETDPNAATPGDNSTKPATDNNAQTNAGTGGQTGTTNHDNTGTAEPAGGNTGQSTGQTDTTGHDNTGTAEPAGGNTGATTPDNGDTNGDNTGAAENTPTQ